MKCKSIRSGRIYDAIEVDDDLLVTILVQGYNDYCPVGTTFVLGHKDVVWLND